MTDGTRTHNHRDHNPGLYQLSYGHRAGDSLAREQRASVARRAPWSELSLDPPRCVIAGRSAGPPGRDAVGTGGPRPGRRRRGPERTGRVQARLGPEPGRGAAWRAQTGAPPAQIGGSRLSLSPA